MTPLAIVLSKSLTAEGRWAATDTALHDSGGLGRTEKMPEIVACSATSRDASTFAFLALIAALAPVTTIPIAAQRRPLCAGESWPEYLGLRSMISLS